jgi:hypothetical protein
MSLLIPLRHAAPPPHPAGRALAWRGPGALILLALVGSALAACASERVLLEQRAGIEVTLRPERYPPRPPPGADFANLQDVQIERSLRRVVIRHSTFFLFVYSNPVPLFTDEQLAALREVLARELPRLPLERRLGFAFIDGHRRNEVDLEIYPEGNYLVYDFRALLRRPESRLGRLGQPVNEAILFPQRDQIVKTGRFPLLRDPIASVVQPDFRLKEGEDKSLPRGGRR